jgi:tetratricopeptide (TPR) repeat protein
MILLRLALGAIFCWTLSAESPAELRIKAAREAIAREPDRAEHHVSLAMALAKRARETADPSFYDQAMEVVRKALSLQPKSFEARRAEVWVLLGKHEFAQARDKAEKLNQEMPDDVLTYGLLTDAYVELGEYDKAEKAAQWMLDLRPGNLAGLTRGAYLRELFGDVDGAIDFMRMALNQTRMEETEDRAWILTHIAHLYLLQGRAEEAEKLLKQALALFPGYHYALANLGKVHMQRRQYVQAVEAFKQRYQAAPHPENLFELAVALQRAGQVRAAQQAFAEFEQKAKAESKSWDNANRELIRYYLDYAKRPREALALAEFEAARRRDVHTLDLLAWALHLNGRHQEARKVMEEALKVGIKDASMLYHAAAIAAALGDRSAAAKYAERSLAANPHSEVAEKARTLAARTTSGSRSVSRQASLADH